jgi:hypothetical protein
MEFSVAQYSCDFFPPLPFPRHLLLKIVLGSLLEVFNIPQEQDVLKLSSL